MKRPLGRFAAVGCALAVALVFAACGDDEPDATTGSSGGDKAEELEDVQVLDGPLADVKVLDNVFEAENIQVAAGTKVVWTNKGRQDHDIVPVEGDWGVDPEGFQPDAVYEHSFDQPGTYRYYCSLHGTETSGMVGAVVVERPNDQEG